MRWKYNDPTEWHPHFLWIPTIIDDEWVWLERVLRQEIKPKFPCMFRWWNYKLMGIKP